MERLNADVGAGHAAVEQAPEVLKSVRVDAAIDVPLGVIDGVVVVKGSKPE
jgi:hypothetical protein